MTYCEYLEQVRKLAAAVPDDQFDGADIAATWRAALEKWVDDEIAKLPTGAAPKIAKLPDAPPPRIVKRSEPETADEKVARIKAMGGKE
jgi:hypothetical protein